MKIAERVLTLFCTIMYLINNGATTRPVARGVQGMDDSREGLAKFCTIKCLIGFTHYYG